MTTHATTSVTASRSPRRLLPWWKKAVFSLLVASLLLGTMELVLRWRGFGGYPAFFQPLPGAQGAHVLAGTADGVIPYFQGAEPGDVRRVGSFVPTPVLVPKPPGTLRLVVLGESSVHGFPWPRHLAAAAILESILRQSYPKNQVEVINAGITAVASFPLRQIAEETIALQPDVVVVYLGHNEFYGAYGVASGRGTLTSVRAMERTHWLRGTALVQGIQRLVRQSLSPTRDVAPTTATRSLMEQMATREDLGPDDPLRTSAQKTLSGNLESILATYRRAGIPVLLCTVGSNLRDLRPVRIAPAPRNQAEKVQELSHAMKVAVSRGPVSAADAAQALLKVHPHHAGAYFVLGRSREMQGDTTGALEAYVRARDLDAMPWRAPSQLNDVIRNLAARHTVPCLDMEKTFWTAASGAPGWDYFADHVHPSLDGQILWAWSMAQALVAHQLLPAPTQPLSHPDPVVLTGGSPLASWRAAHLMASLFQRPPLQSDDAAAGHWFGVQKRMVDRMPPILQGTVQSYIELAMQSPNGDPGSIEAMAAEAYFARKQWLKAAQFFQNAVRETPPLTTRRTYLGWQELAARYLADGTATGRQLISQQAKARVTEGLRGRGLISTTPPELLESLAGLSILANDKAGVLKYGNQIPEDSPNKTRLQTLAQALQLARRTTTTTATQGTR
jgi:lysophospholipase L1-like esterase